MLKINSVSIGKNPTNYTERDSIVKGIKNAFPVISIFLCNN